MSGVIRCSASHEPTAAEVVRCAEERALLGFPLRRFARFSEIEFYLDRLASSRWWSETFPEAPIEIHLQRRSRQATFSAAATEHADTPAPQRREHDPRWGGRADPSGIIWLVDGRGWGLETVLHEMAHLAAGAEAGHGDVFVDSLCGLWRHEAGVEPWAALSAAFSSCELRDAARRDGCPRPPRRP